MYVLYRQELNRSHFSVCNVERWPGSRGLKISDTQCHGIIASVYNRYKVGLLIYCCTIKSSHDKYKLHADQDAQLQL